VLAQCSKARREVPLPARKGAENKTLHPVKACTFITKVCGYGSFLMKAVAAEKAERRGI